MDLKLLIHECKQGSRRSQKELYNTFAHQMMAICMRYSKSREEAEDIMQEGFVQAFQNLDKFRFEGSFEGWLRRIMLNRALQHYRSKSHLFALVSANVEMVEPSVDEEVHQSISAKELLLLIQQLPQYCRLVFNLFVFEGFKHKEIARLLGISEGTSKSNLFDARHMLQQAILQRHSADFKKSQSL